jgi:hypothetical protein
MTMLETRPSTGLPATNVKITTPTCRARPGT